MFCVNLPHLYKRYEDYIGTIGGFVERGKIKMGEPFGSPLIHVTLSVFNLVLAYLVRITI
jgi:hypothetical protein